MAGLCARRFGAHLKAPQRDKRSSRRSRYSHHACTTRTITGMKSAASTMPTITAQKFMAYPVRPSARRPLTLRGDVPAPRSCNESRVLEIDGFHSSHTRAAV